MSETQASKGTVLVIEDDPDFSAYLAATLQDHGYETDICMDGDKALEQARTSHPAGITLDILLPGRTGISIYRKLRKDSSTRSIPIVIVSGVGTEGKKLAIERFFAGRSVPEPDGVLQKPVEPEALIDAVDSAIHKAVA